MISADVQGAIRAWPLPLRFSRVMATAKSPFHTALVDEYADAVIATTLASALVRLDPGGVAEEIGPHESSNIILKRSGSGAFFATYGLRDLVEIWSLPSMTRIHLIDTGHGSISHLAFIDQTDDFVTSGHDGRLVRWTMSGSQALIAKFDKAIKGLAVAHGTESLVFSTDDGALWRTNAGNDVVLVKDGGIIVNQLYSNPDDPTVYVGYANGDMIALSTRTWQHETVLRAPGAIREIASINKGTLLAAASSDGTIQIGRRHGEGSGSLELSWTRLPARARRIVFTRDGLLIAACVSGIIWIYDTVHRRWSYLIVGATDLRDIVVTSNGKSAAVVDTGGNLLWIDLESARKYSSSTDVIGTK